MIPVEQLVVPEIEEAVHLHKESSYPREELELYDKHWDRVRIQKAYLADAFKEGKLERIKEGELKMTIETATRLVKKGFSNEDIADIRGLKFQGFSLYVKYEGRLDTFYQNILIQIIGQTPMPDLQMP